MQPSATAALRSVLDAAQAEARQRNQEFVSTEHLLLALLASSAGQAGQIIRQQRVPIDALRSTIEKQITPGSEPSVVEGALPLSPKAQRTFNNAIVLSQSLRESKVTTRHLLMALLNDSTNHFLTALARSGGDPDSLTRTVAVPPTEAEA
jgi:ATP-dependent Clp protease ATP-binding subunit ClpC